MARKRHRICMMPRHLRFALENSKNGAAQMPLNEYETIHLIDLEELTEEQCAE